jgi:phage anti-repressor protein
MSLSELDDGYNGDLLALIQQEMPEGDQKMFAMNFAAYLKYDQDDFVIDLDDVWQWIGFTMKQSYVRLLKNKLTEDRHYRIINPKDENSSQVGRPETKYMLTILGFKKLCMLAGTDKAIDIHEYYIKMEGIMHRFLKGQLSLRDNAARVYCEPAKDALLYVAEKGDFNTVDCSLNERVRRVMLQQPVTNTELTMKLVDAALKRYSVEGQTLRCDKEHSIMIVKAASVFVDTLTSCYEGIGWDEIVSRVCRKLVGIHPGVDRDALKFLVGEVRMIPRIEIEIVDVIAKSYVTTDEDDKVVYDEDMYNTYVMSKEGDLSGTLLTFDRFMEIVRLLPRRLVGRYVDGAFHGVKVRTIMPQLPEPQHELVET